MQRQETSGWRILQHRENYFQRRPGRNRNRPGRTLSVRKSASDRRALRCHIANDRCQARSEHPAAVLRFDVPGPDFLLSVLQFGHLRSALHSAVPAARRIPEGRVPEDDTESHYTAAARARAERVAIRQLHAHQHREHLHAGRRRRVSAWSRETARRVLPELAGPGQPRSSSGYKSSSPAPKEPNTPRGKRHSTPGK